MVMFKPPHPGRHIRETCIEPLGMSVTETAKALGVTRQTLNNLVNERSGISPEMAVRLEKMGWGTAEGWLRLQLNYDLAEVRRREKEINVQPPSAA